MKIVQWKDAKAQPQNRVGWRSYINTLLVKWYVDRAAERNYGPGETFLGPKILSNI